VCSLFWFASIDLQHCGVALLVNRAGSSRRSIAEAVMWTASGEGLISQVCAEVWIIFRMVVSYYENFKKYSVIFWYFVTYYR